MDASSCSPELLANASTLKRNNALTAMLCGALPALLLAIYSPPTHRQWLIGLAIGLVWANAFEYFYHRYLLHHTRGRLGKGHILHHISSGKENELEHLTFGESPLYVMLLFGTNGSPVALADLIWRFPLTPGILLGFTAYFIAVEEIHWRIHRGGWLPPGLHAAIPYHLDHHDIPEGRYNVFFPLFDLLLGTATPRSRTRRRCAFAREGTSGAFCRKRRCSIPGSSGWRCLSAYSARPRPGPDPRVVATFFIFDSVPGTGPSHFLLGRQSVR